MRGASSMLLWACLLIPIVSACDSSAPSKPLFNIPGGDDLDPNKGAPTPATKTPTIPVPPVEAEAELPVALKGKFSTLPQHAASFQTIGGNVTSSFHSIDGTYIVGHMNGLSIAKKMEGPWITKTKSSGLPSSFINSIDEIGGVLYIGTKLGFATTTDKATFKSYSKKEGIPAEPVIGVAGDNTNLFVCSDNALLITNDKAVTWTINTTFKDCTAVLFHNKIAFILDSGELHSSVDLGKTWTKVLFYGNAPKVTGNSMSLSGDQIVVSAEDGFYITMNDGKEWKTVKLAVDSTYQNPSKFIDFKGIWYAILSDKDTGVHVLGISKDKGATWAFKKKSDGIGGDNEYGNFYLGLAVNADGIFISTGWGLAYSNDSAVTFKNVLRKGSFGPYSDIRALLTVNDTIYAATKDGSSFTSDIGQTWNDDDAPYGSEADVLAMCGDKKNILKFAKHKLFLSTDFTKTWTEIPGAPTQITSCAIEENIIVLASTKGVHISQDLGVSWVTSNTASGLGSDTISDVFIKGQIILAATTFGLSRSENLGLSWSTKSMRDGLAGDAVNSIHFNDGKFYFGTSDGISVSSDDCKTFKTLTVFKDKKNNIGKIVTKDKLIFAATDFGIGISPDEGKSWHVKGIDQGLESERITAIALVKDSLIVGTPLGASVLNPSFEVVK